MTRPPEPPAVLNRVKLIRAGRAWTQAELSRRSGVPVATISRWENQLIKSYDARVLAALSRALQVEVGVLLVRNDEHRDK